MTTSQDLQEINKFVFHEISRATDRAQMQERKLITSRVHLHFRQPEIPPHFSPLPDHHFLHFSPLPLRLSSPSSLPFWLPCLAWHFELLSFILIIQIKTNLSWNLFFSNLSVSAPINLKFQNFVRYILVDS